jgi:hypothetical protein
VRKFRKRLTRKNEQAGPTPGDLDVKKSQRKSRKHRNAPRQGNAPKAQSANANVATATSVPVIKSKKIEPSVSVEAAPSWSWRDRLFDPIEIASIAVFRISFGLLLLHDVYKYFANGWIKSYYIDPPYHFAFFGLDFIRPLPGDGMFVLFGVLAVCSALIALGLFYRLAMTVFFLGFTYIFLIDQARYLNHFYFVSLLAFLMIFVPAARGWSLDALIAGRSQDARVPAWSLWLLRIQMEIMLLYAGIVKLNADWLQGEPLGKWLSMSADLPIIGPFLLNDTVVLIGAWGAAFLHLIGAIMLLFKSTRIYAFAAYCVFHYLNHHFFIIGIFPWLTLAATLLFFDPDWPKVVWRNVTRLLPFGLSTTAPKPQVAQVSPPWHIPTPAMRTAIIALVVGWAVFQALLPLRHWLYPGNNSWHEQGHNFAWQMMLRQKLGRAVFYVRDPDTSREWLVDPRKFLSSRQYWFMAERPEMIRQFAHYLEKVWTERYGTRDVEVRAFTAASLNGRRSQALIDPKRDLSKVGYTFGNSDWILPLREPMPPKAERWPSDEKRTLLRVIKADPAARRLLASRDSEKVSSRSSEKSKKVMSGSGD